MLNTTPQLKRLSSTSTSPDTLHTIVFSLAADNSSAQGDYLFALPVETVLKVINCPPINWVVDSGIGMADFGSQTVTVVDWCRQFLLTNPKRQEERNAEQVANSYRFLILLKTPTEELCGIPVANPPLLTDIPLSTVRPVPPSYRQAARLNLVSHMAVLSETQEERPLKVFLLGMSKILTPLNPGGQLPSEYSQAQE